jgi:2-polyprenyl-6-methoxyphenol hydroxylase-like FAD-dependent oxidoreductase
VLRRDEVTESRVLIVGAGPGGAALGLLLASRGVETTLVERQHDFAREFRGEAMMPSGLHVLEDMGVDLSAVPHKRPTHFRGYRNRRCFLDLSVDPEALGGQPLTVSQPHLLEHLVERASREPGFRFVRGGTVRELTVENGRVVGVRVRTDQGEELLRAQLVVGADGRASVVRRSGGFQVRDLGAPMDIVWYKLPWPESWDEVQVRGYLGGGHLLIALPAPDGGLQVAWVILKGTYGELRSRGIEEWAREMAAHVDPEFAEYLLGHVSEISRPFLLDSVTDRVLGWARPGVLLIGDAAHTMSPVGGQGLNLALRDAVVAANQLVPVLQKGGSDADVDAAAARVEELRGPEIDPIQRLAAVPPRVVMGRRFYHTWARALVTHLVGTSFGRRRAAPIALTFFEGVTDVSLEV